MVRKPSTSRIRTIWMAILATLIGSALALGTVNLVDTASRHAGKITQIQDGTYSIGRALGASFATFIEGAGFGLIAFLFVLPTALLYGITSHLALLKTGLWRKWQYALLGAIVGMPAIFSLASLSSVRAEDAPGLLFLGSFTGAFTALIFRLLMGGKRASPSEASWHNAFAHAGTPLSPKTPHVLKAAGLAVLLGGGAHLLFKVASYFAGNFPWFLDTTFNQVQAYLKFLPNMLGPMALYAFVAALGCIAIHAAHLKLGRRSYATYIAAGAILALFGAFAHRTILGLLIYGAGPPLMQLPTMIFWTALQGAIILWIFRWLIERYDNAQPLPSSPAA
ncbi:MAG: hypothetical protein V3V03_07795 [Hyphomonadaceae bacterium]